MEAIITTALIASAVATALYLGNWLPIALPQVSPLLDRKPFNCRPCTTFHLTWILIGLVTLFRASWQLSIVGVIVAFILFFIVQKIDNNKIIK